MNTKQPFYSLTLDDGRHVEIFEPSAFDFLMATLKAGLKTELTGMYVCLEIVRIDGHQMEGIEDLKNLSIRDLNKIVEVMAVMNDSTIFTELE